MLVSCCVRSGTIFSNRNRECATVRSERQSKRRERDGSSAGSASVGGPRRVELCWLVCAVCLLSSLLGEDVIWTEPLKGNRPAGGSQPFKEAWLQLWQCEGCYCYWGNVIEVEEFYDREEPS